MNLNELEGTRNLIKKRFICSPDNEASIKIQQTRKLRVWRCKIILKLYQMFFLSFFFLLQKLTNEGELESDEKTEG